MDQYQYDAAWNLTYDGTHHYASDDEGRISAVETAARGYEYDANGLWIHRVGSAGPLDYTYDIVRRAVGMFWTLNGVYDRGAI